MIARCAASAALGLLFLLNTAFAAQDYKCEVHSEAPPELCSHEPSTLGYTQDSDDSGFLDFKLSVQYQLAPVFFTKNLNRMIAGSGDTSAFYGAFTGRFGQYIATRDSSPVVGKRFNPKLFFRHWTDVEHRSYIDFSFLAHESNGQSIDSLEEYQAARAASKKASIADDHLSRGWDYLELSWKSVPIVSAGTSTVSTYLTYKYFLPRGPLQGRAENYNAWEDNPEGKRREFVSGVSGMFKYQYNGERWYAKDWKFAVSYETGYRLSKLLRYHTGRLEIGKKVSQLPLTWWIQSGYNSDLAQYFKKVTSWGVELEIGSF